MNEERPIEKLLRRYAKKRRDDAGAPELHPATRRLLQGEVARQFPKPASGPEKTSFAQVLKGWLPWLGWAAAIIVVVAIVGVTMFGGHETRSFASKSNGTSPVEMAKNEPAPQPTFQQTGERDAETRKQLAAAPPAAPAASSLSPAKTERPPDPSSVVLADETKTFREVKSLEETVGGAKGRAQPMDKDGFANAKEAQAPAPVTAAPSAAQSSRLRADSSAIAPAARRAGNETRAEPPPPASVATTDFADAKKSTDTPSLAGASPTGKLGTTQYSNDSFAGGSRADRAGSARGGGSPTPGSYQRTESALSIKSQNISQSYANVESTKRFKKSGDIQNGNIQFEAVLANFRIEQAGNQLKVIDGDGSTYLGTVSPENLTKAKLETKGAEQLKKDAAQTAAPGPLGADAEAARAYLFRVAGTNRTLNQQVEFSWNFVPTNAVLMRQLTGNLEAEQNRGAQLAPSLLQNSEVSGEVKVNTQRMYRIQAVPTR